MASELTGGSTVGGERIETTVGAQTKVNTHANDTTVHFTPTERTKLTGISTGAKNTINHATNGSISVDGVAQVVYTHPSSHFPSIIQQDVNNRFVSDAKIADWDSRETTTGAQAKATAAQNAAIAWVQSYGLGSTAASFPTADLNNIVAPSGIYNSSGLTNAPNGDAGWFFIIHLRHANATGYLSQIAIPFARSAMYTRSCNGGVWSAWIESETTAGSQAKVNTHAGDASAHLSVADRTKFTGIAAGAQPNQNTFANVKVGATIIAADNATDTLELVAGSNVVLTPDAGTDKLTISAPTPPEEQYETFASDANAGGPGVYGIVTWYRVSDGTKHMESNAYGPDANGYSTYLDLTYYNAAGTAVAYTESWVMTYDVNGVPLTKQKV